MPRRRSRLDLLLVERGYFSCRTKAQRAILAGQVLVDDQRIDKAGQRVCDDASLQIVSPGRTWVSRGGEKLVGAHAAFGFSAQGRTCLDSGSSTGGFTQVLLELGASLVYAVDVGYGQLAWELRQDRRVIVLERTNLRHLTLDALHRGRPDLAVLDLSFISLTKVIPTLAELMAPCAELVALVKPQFEAGRGLVGKGGVVKDSEIHAQVVCTVSDHAAERGFQTIGVVPSPLRGPHGNREFFLHLVRDGHSQPTVDRDDIIRIIGCERDEGRP